jgi:hypothetical protein
LAWSFCRAPSDRNRCNHQNPDRLSTIPAHTLLVCNSVAEFLCEKWNRRLVKT